MRKFVQNSLLLILLIGCVSISNDSIEIARREAIKEIKRGCMKDIFWGMQPDYPLTNYSTYRTLMDMGIEGPSPEEWCREYARTKVQ